ncbi:hypothetical protein BC827DRAFT_1248877 [Russula dissimulans]|nr:hypothetical protein BC827DRAFT_1248877 [Russula dissimulans]
MTSPAISIQSSQASGGPRSGPLGAGVEGVPAPSLRSVGNRRFCSHDSVKYFFHEEDLDVSPLTPQDHVLSWMTPDVTSTRFTALFGGFPKEERPRSRLRNILCFNPEAQPYAPTLPGETGLLLVMPNTVLLEDKCDAFHIFINMSPPSAPNVECSFRYFGTYTKVPVTRTTLEADEWRSLPPRCRTLWSWRILSSTVPNVRNILARMCVRTERPNGPPPSPNEINNWLENNPRRHEGAKQRIVNAALDSGEEVVFNLRLPFA